MLALVILSGVRISTTLKTVSELVLWFLFGPTRYQFRGEVSSGLARGQTFTDRPKDAPYLKLKLGEVGTIFLAGTA